MKLVDDLAKFVLFVSFIVGASVGHAFTLLKSSNDEFKWYQSTVLGGLVKPVNDRSEIFPVLNPKNLRKIDARYWKAQGQSKGLYLIVPGTGATSSSGQANTVAETIANSGFDTLVLTNPFSDDFQTVFSSDELVGFPQKDVVDYVTLTDAAVAQYEALYGKPKRIGVVGISLGSTYGVLLGRMETKYRLDRVIAINPPVDLGYSIDQVDRMVRVRLSQPNTSLIGLFFRSVLPLMRFLKANPDVEQVGPARVRSVLSHSEDENSALIGASFQRSLISILQGLKNAPHFNTSADWVRIDRITHSITFSEYMGIIGIAIETPKTESLTFRQQIEDIDLRTLLRSSPILSKIYVFSASDDFIVTPSQFQDVEHLIGNRLIMFKAGGHCGEVWTNQFKSALRAVLNK